MNILILEAMLLVIILTALVFIASLVNFLIFSEPRRNFGRYELRWDLAESDSDVIPGPKRFLTKRSALKYRDGLSEFSEPGENPWYVYDRHEEKRL